MSGPGVPYPFDLRLIPPAANMKLQLQPAGVAEAPIVVPALPKPFITVIGNDPSYNLLWSGWSGGDSIGGPAVFVVFSDVVSFDRAVHLRLLNTTYVRFQNTDPQVFDFVIPAGQWWGWTNLYLGVSGYPTNVGATQVTASCDGYDDAVGFVASFNPFPRGGFFRYQYASEDGAGANAGGDTALSGWNQAVSLTYHDRATITFCIDGFLPLNQNGTTNPYIEWNITTGGGLSSFDIYKFFNGAAGAGNGLGTYGVTGQMVTIWLNKPAASGNTITVAIRNDGVINPTSAQQFPVTFTFA